jgi:hypothetical protein
VLLLLQDLNWNACLENPMSNWKTTSHFLTYMAHKFGVALCTPEAENGFQLVGSNAFVPHPELDCQFTRLTPKSVRRWLWEVRHNPVWQQPGVLVYIERESPTSWSGKVGLVGSSDLDNAIVFEEIL